MTNIYIYAYCDSLKKEFIHCPTFATKVTNTSGSVEAMLSIVALCIKEKIDNNISLFLGSLALAQSVDPKDNTHFVDKNNLLKKIKYSVI